MSDYKTLKDMDEFYKLLEEMKWRIQHFYIYRSDSAMTVYSFDNIHDRDSIYDFLSNWTAISYKSIKLYRDHNIAEDEYYLIFAK